MILTDIVNYFKGYIGASVSGRQPERFLNLARSENLCIWKLKREERKLNFRILRKDFFKLFPIAKKTGVRVRVTEKKGFFLVLKRLKKRKTFAALIFLFFIIINVLSSFVLKIEIMGNTKIPEEKIIAKLNEIDLKKFTLRSNIDSEEISIALRSGFDTIAWVGVYEEGTKVTIDIKERVKAPELIDKKLPCHMVAKRDGIIKALTVENGERAVANNQKVKKGQILINGIIPVKGSDEKRCVHSLGSAIAETEYIKETDFKLYTYNKIYTGNEKKSVSLKAFGKELKKWATTPYFNSDSEIKRRVIGIFEINTIIYKEYTLHKKSLEKAAAEKIIKEEIKLEFKKELKGKTINGITFNIIYKDKEAGALKAVARCTEEIAEKKEIKICPSESSAPNPSKE